MKKLFTSENMATFGFTLVAMLLALAIWPHVRKFIPGASKTTTTVTPSTTATP